MVIRRADLEQIMAYLEKEEVKELSITKEKVVGDRLYFEFEDKKLRACKVTLFAAENLTYPSLTKTMDLYTRLPEGTLEGTDNAEPTDTD